MGDNREVLKMLLSFFIPNLRKWNIVNLLESFPNLLITISYGASFQKCWLKWIEMESETFKKGLSYL